MDYTLILQALEATSSPDKTIRTKAEDYLKQIERNEGYCPAMLKIAVDSQVTNGNQTLAQAASIFFKQTVVDCWKFTEPIFDDPDIFMISENDKSLVRDNILDCIAQCQSNNVIKQLEESLKDICSCDFPGNWPDSIDKVGVFLTSNEENKIYAALVTLRQMAKTYEFELDSKRQPLDLIISKLFPVIESIFQNLLAVEGEKSYNILLLIARIFYSTTQLQLSDLIVNSDIIVKWMGFFKYVLDKPVPPELETPTTNSEEIEKRESSRFWQLKAQVAQVTYRFYQRYGNPTFAEKNKIQLAKVFEETYASPLLESHLKIFYRNKTNYVASKTLCWSIKYINQSTKSAPLYKLLEPQIETILYNDILPVLYFTEKDYKLWQEDAVEYIRRTNDFTDSFVNPRNAALDFVQYLMKKRKNKSDEIPVHLPKFLNFCNENLIAYATAKQNNQSPDIRIKDAILQSIGVLCDIIKEIDQFSESVETMLKIHVLPEFSNEHGFIRFRACWLYGEFWNLDFEDTQTLKEATTKVYQCMSDTDLPVRVKAGCSLRLLLKNEEVPDMLRPILPNILERYLSIMNEIDFEELVASLEEIVNQYDNEIAPYAIGLSEHLAKAYLRMAEADIEENEGETALAAVGCIGALKKILDSMGHKKDMFDHLEHILYPVVCQTMTPDGVECLEDGCDLIALLLYHAPKVSEKLWVLYPILIDIILGPDEIPQPDLAQPPHPADKVGYGYEFFGNMGCVFQNYISTNPQLFFTAISPSTGTTYLDLMFKMIAKVFTITRAGHSEIDAIVATKLLITIIENLPVELSHLIENIVKVVVEQIGPARSDNYKSMLIQTISMCIWRNCTTTLQIMEQNGWTAPLFQQWFQLLPQVSHDFEMRRIIFGLCTIMQQNITSLPQIVQQGLGDILKQTNKIAEKDINARLMPKFKQKPEEAEVDDITGGLDEDDLEDSDYEGDDDDYDWTGGDLDLYKSPLDQFDELNIYRSTFEGIATQDKAKYDYLMNIIGEEEKSKMAENFQKITQVHRHEEENKKKLAESTGGV